jgi:hypothetical protein
MRSGNKVCALGLLACLLATTVGCSASWIKVALADLPVLAQMAINLGSLVTTLESGKQLTAQETLAIQNISTEASRDLALLQTLYTEYRQNPSTGTLAEIEKAISDAEQNLPALLTAAHIGDPILGARIAAGVNLILTTVESFAALIPQPQTQAVAMIKTRMQAQSTHGVVKPPTVSQLKQAWNTQVYPQFQ